MFVPNAASHTERLPLSRCQFALHKTAPHPFVFGPLLYRFNPHQHRNVGATLNAPSKTAAPAINSLRLNIVSP